MNQELFVQFLSNLSTEELFFRSCHKKQYSAAQIRSILQNLSIHPAFPDGSAIPESMRTLSDTILPQEDSCRVLLHRKIQLLKHPCFMPPIRHTHTFFEALYVLNGTCTHTLLNHTMQLHTGDFCLLSPAVSHSLCANEDSIVLLLQIDRGTIEALNSSVLHNLRADSITEFFHCSLYQKDYASYLLFHTEDDEELRTHLLDMFQEEFHSEEYAEYMLSNMLSIFFIKLIRKYKKIVEVPSFISPSYAEASYIYQYVQSHYVTASLNDLAKQLNYSVPYCSKYVKQYTGRSFSDLLRQIRFRIAAEYLLNTDLTVEKISERIGYANPENFMRMFKKTYGLSPTQYRITGDRSLKPLSEKTPHTKIRSLPSMDTDYA